MLIPIILIPFLTTKSNLKPTLSKSRKFHSANFQKPASPKPSPPESNRSPPLNGKVRKPIEIDSREGHAGTLYVRPGLRKLSDAHRYSNTLRQGRKSFRNRSLHQSVPREKGNCGMVSTRAQGERESPGAAIDGTGARTIDREKGDAAVDAAASAAPTTAVKNLLD